MTKKKKFKLIDLINLTLDDKDIKTNNDLTTMLTHSKALLNKGIADNLVASKLNNEISMYTLKNHLEVPAALVELSKHLQKSTNWYRGFMSSITWFTN